MKHERRGVLLVGAALLLAGGPVGAIVARAYPLEDVISGADTIVECRVAVGGVKAETARLERVAGLKGEPVWNSIAVRLPGGDDGKQVPILGDRLKAGRTVLLFRKAKRFTLGYVEGTWFRLAEPAQAGNPWQFVHLEPFLRRTFRGTSAEMGSVIRSVLAGKAKAPAPDPAAKPGYGN